MYVKKPSPSLSAPNVHTLESGVRIERIHSSRFGGNEFNPCQGSPTRFAPIHDINGACVPSLYAGSSLESAFYETIFHDVPAKAAIKTITRQSVINKTHSTLKTTRKLQLASLRAPDLKKWNVTRSALIGSSAAHYSSTALWAMAIHEQHQNIHGLIWTSNQCDPDSAIIFFGDRVHADDLEIIYERIGSQDASLLTDARLAGRRSDIVIIS